MKNRDFKDSRLLEAFDYIDQKYIAEVADSLRFEKTAPIPAKGFDRRTWRHIIALAACMLLLGAIIPVLSYVIRNFTDISAWFPKDTTEESYPLTEPETPPEETTTLSPETTEEETTAPDQKESIGLEYKISDDGKSAMLVGIGTCTDRDIVIASEYNGVPVTAIGECALSNLTSLKSVRIPEGVETIMLEAFYHCTSLSEVSLPSTLETIGSWAFAECESIVSINIPDSVKRINDKAFAECVNLTSLNLGAGVEQIMDSAFMYCRSLKSITVPGSVKEISNSAFAGCTELDSVTLSKGIEKLGFWIFSDCLKLNEITYTGTKSDWGKVFVPEEAFGNIIIKRIRCSDGDIILVEEDPKNGSLGLEYKAFDNYAVLVGIGTCTDKDIVIASEYNGLPVTEIWHEAFVGVKGITSVTISEGVTYIESHAFENCPDLRAVYLPSTLENITGSLLTHGFYNCPAIESIKIAEGGRKYYSVGNCLIERETGTLVFGCGKSAIPNDGSVESIGSFAFSGSRLLTDLRIPEGVNTIHTGAFAGCENLKSLSLPKSLRTIQRKAFEGCSSLTSVTIPEGVEEIYNGAFRGCKKLKNVTLPNSLTLLDSEAFLGTAIESIVIPNGVKELGAVFSECEKLVSITLPAGFEGFVGNTFAGCTSLKSLTLPKSLERIGMYTFYGCSALTDLRFEGRVKEWNAISKQERWNEGAAFTKIKCSDGEAETNEYDGSRGLEYKISDDGKYAILVGIGTCTDKDIVVASTYNGLPVKVIGERALYYEKADSIRVSDTIEIIEEEALGAGKYTSLYISASVRQLEGAFSTCDKLEKIEVDKNNPIYRNVNNCLINTQTQTLVLGCINSVIPADGSVTVIGNKAFETARITNITIPEGITEIGEEAFAWCVMLESIVIPDSVKIIGDLAFADCERAKTLKLGKSIESIGNGAFYCCFLITEVKLPQSLKTLGSNAFGNTRIKSLVIPDGVKFPEGAHNMFASCDYLESIVLPSGIESFGSWFLGGCENLKSITIPSSVKAIGDYAFYGCRSLKEIIIPEGVTEIGEGAFKQCTGITSIVVPESVKSIGNKAFAGCTELVSITLPSSITEIAASTFSECTKLHQINIPSGVASIGSHAFKDCTSLEALTLPDSVKTIGEYTFNGCSALKDIDLGEGLESIATWAFENCTSLKQIVLPESMKDIAHHAFVRSGLESVRIPKGIKRINDGVFGACVSLKDVSLPEGLTEIGYSAFSYCTSLETLVIPNTVTMIGGEIFKNCTSLKSLTIPSSVKTLQGSQHFMNCTSLTNMTIPEGITMQFEYYNMFDGCTSLTSVTLPRDLPRVSRAIFRNCSALTEINYGGSIAQWNSLKKQDNWNSGCAATVIHCSDGTVELYTSHSYDGSRGLQYKVNTDGKTVSFVGIGACTDSEIVIASSYDGKPVTEIIESALADNTKITGVIIPNSVLKIGQNAFARCAALKSIEIPDSVITVGSGTFYQCTALESVKFGSGITEIGNDMFYKCSALESVVLGENIKKIGAHSFCHCVKLNNVIVPDSVESIEMYAFENCSSLTEMTLGKGLKALGERSLAADNLTQVSFRGTKESWNSIAFDEKWNLYSGITVIHCSDGDFFIAPITQTWAYEAAREFLGIPKDQIGEKYLFAAKAKDPSHLDCYRVVLCEYVPDIGYMGEYEVVREVYVNQITGECTEVVFDYPDIPEVFLDVIFNREKFTFVDKEYSSDGYTYKTEECYLKTFELLPTCLFGAEPQLYALLDIDGDSVPELIFSYISSTRYRLILRYYDGKIYGYSFGGDGLMTDCTNPWHEGAGDVRVLDKLYFDGLYLKSRELLRYDSGDPDNVKYYVEGKETTKAEYEKFAAQYDGEYLKYTTLDLYPVYVNPFPGG